MDGANALHNALQQHDGGMLDNLSGYLNSEPDQQQARYTGHVFGDAKQFKCSIKTNWPDAGSIATILATLALSFWELSRQQHKGGFDPARSGYLNGQQQQAQAAAPDMMGSLTSLFGFELTAA
jgi:hypothetical protein